MRVEEFLAHHGIGENPFGEEDAQTDHVFREFCVNRTYHSAWDKIYGNPAHPATSVVFGEKGSGKTALRLQIVQRLEEYNREHPEQRTFIIEYDDFNPFLDSFRERLSGRKRRADRALEQWRLWDHMDAILSLGVRRLVREILHDETNTQQCLVTDIQLEKLNRLQKRDLLLLETFYDHTYDQPPRKRWSALRKKLRFHSWFAHWDVGVGIFGTLVTLALACQFESFHIWWLMMILIIFSWSPWLWRQAKLMWLAWKISRQIRVFDHLPNTLRSILSRFQRQELAGQPTPSKDRSDDRYELLMKLQSVLKVLGFSNIVVLVDRVDEPHLVNGSPERMRDLLWPMFDNKFLKQPGIGFKMLLPAEVVYYLNREEKEFYERSRLDKQNLIASLEWTGESLYDLASARMKGCAENPNLEFDIRILFDDSLTHDELIGLFARLRVPRHLFKFLYRLLVDHCNKHSEANPAWKISRETLQATLAVYQRDMDSFDRGMGTG